LKILLAFFGGQRSWNRMRRVAQPYVFASEHVVVDLEMQFGLLTGGDFSEINLIAVLPLAFLFQRQVCFGGDDSDFLIGIGLSGRNPHADAACRRQIFHRESIVESETARILCQGGQSESKKQGRQHAKLAQHRRLPSGSQPRTESGTDNQLETTHGRLIGNAVK